MQLSPIGLPLEALDTPALLLDLDAFDHNVATMARHFRDRQVAWRPHAKAFKSPAIAHALLKAGAIGMTVAKVSEAEVFAAAGITDLLIAHLVVGDSKAARLAALQRHAEVKATVDDPAHLGPLSRAATEAAVTIPLLIDVDLGLNRCGVPTPDAAVSLAQKIASTPGLRLDGLMGYEGHTLYIQDTLEKRNAITAAIARLDHARAALESAGFPCPIRSAGGSGSYQITSDFPAVTEIQAGGGIFACRYYTEVCQVQGHQPAIHVLATVISRPAPDRLVLDAGQKSLSQYLSPAVLPDHPTSQVVGLSAEHATVRVDSSCPLAIGDRVRLIPGYSDFTFVLHDRVIAHRTGRVEAVWELLGRGKLQ